MDAKRLEEIKRMIETVKQYSSPPKEVQDLIEYIDQQQAEIDRLNRAYNHLSWHLYSGGRKNDADILAEAQRIKDGEQG